MKTKLALAFLTAVVISACSSGCAVTPYYLSDAGANVDTSKDGSHITGAGVDFRFSPNPNYPLPAASPKTNGLAK